jgi:hypothetical protein
VNSTLVLDSVSDAIDRDFIFLPLDISHPEGWNAAHTLHFKSLPVLAIVRPNGHPLSQSGIILKHEGPIGEATLLSYLAIRESHDGAITFAQDAEFEQAVAEATANQRRADEIAAEAETEEMVRFDARIGIERSFIEIPVPADQSEAVTIRFLFPDNSTLTRRFFQNGPIRWLFAFVRKFVFPREFLLFTGFPLIAIGEDDGAIASICRDRAFIVTVEYGE